MRNIRLLHGLLMLACCLQATTVRAGEPPEVRQPVLAVFDFTTPRGQEETGKRVAFQFTQKLKREGAFVIVDAYSLAGILREKKFDPYKAPPAKAAEFIRDQVGAQLAIFGEASKSRKAIHVKFRILEVMPDGHNVLADVDRQLDHFRDTTEFIQVTVWALAGREPPKKRVVVNELSGNVLPNGDFETLGPDGVPVKWGIIDNLTAFCVDMGDGHGKVLRQDTDVNLSQWKQWQARIKAGAKAADAPAKTPTRPPKYDTVGGNNGVAVYSDWIKVKPGVSYKIDYDARGIWAEPWFFPKVFVKGYKFREGQRREIWRMYKAMRFKEAGKKWEHFVRTFHPDEKCEWMRVQIYSYWPPYENYMYDNIRIVEVEEKWVKGDWRQAPLERRSR